MKVGGYQLGERLGQGGSGTVWRAERVSAACGSSPVTSSGPVAIKLSNEAPSGWPIDELRREAATLAELDHPHIVRLLEVLDVDGCPGLVMGLAQGGSLAGLLAERGRLSPGEAVAVLAPVADALASAHRRGLVHGDVKPSNVLLTSDGEPLLADFGAAGRWGRHHRDQPVAGTEPYLDPAVLAGGASTPASDLYALAVTGHELVTGHLPGPDGVDRLRADRSVPADLVDTLRSGLEPSPSKRPADLQQFAADLRGSVPAPSIVLPGPSSATLTARAATGYSGGEGGQGHRTRQFGPRPPAPVIANRRWRGRRPALAVLAVVAASAAVGGLWVQRSPSASRADHPRPSGAVTRAAALCPALPALGPAPGEVQLRGDINGDHCPVPVTWDGQVMRVRLRPTDAQPVRFRFDRRGQLLLGDWNCDGRATPALFLAATGEVVYYNRFADRSDEVGVEERGVNVTGAPGRSAHTVRNEDGCDEVQAGPGPG